MTDVNQDLYEAATNSLAAEASSDNTWKKMVMTALTFAEVDAFKVELAAVEARIKEEYDLTFMPNPWRSAKSVVLNAMTHGLNLLDSNAEPKGKTAVQMELKELVAKTYVESMSPEEQANYILSNFFKKYAKADAEVQKNIKMKIQSWIG